MFDKLNVRNRLTIGLVINILLLFGVGLLSLLNVQNMKNQVERIFKSGVLQIENLFEIRYAVSNNLSKTLHKLGDNQISKEQGASELKTEKTELSKDWQEYISDNHIFTTDENLAKRNLHVEELRPKMEKILEFINKTEALAMAGDIPTLDQFVTAEFYPLIEPFTETLGDLIRLHLNDAHLEYQDALNRSYWLTIATTAFLITALALALFLAWLLTRSIVDPLQYAADSVDRISEGDVNFEIHSQSGGEFGTLLNAVSNMVDSTKEISSVLTTVAKGDLTREAVPRSEKDILSFSLNDMIRNMRAMIGETKQEVNSQMASTKEIMSSLALLSRGASETASAVTETTTTMEELKQTSHVSVEKAKDVLESIKETLQTAQTSGKALENTISDMSIIKERMNTISSAILKLSEKGLAIAEIMDSVNDIAEQSNLLAVNAAIEAAKAGDSGKGFGVVAQEIRALAEQSKDATLRVKSLLLEIQNATNAAVLATEQGSKAVEKGVAQSMETNSAMKILAEKTSHETQAANQILLSSEQQLIATDQIRIAMTSINDATNQHIIQLQQIEDAIKMLNNIGEALKNSTDRYKLITHTSERYEKNW